ncbi:2-amino-4-hydroxy-6-hydroxymethyldihydropteridine diphosphokinase [Qipengyuania sp. DSG2-2]|uniref:2-amino-4-hydroxy-6- hydroxymethyldihydropteridine diphosphokinase n=1 Tax=Qipengyuania sp. DGS2-2 TaxID=3349631 RepID=UPI0036D28B73
MGEQANHQYIIATGSNQRHPRHGSPAAVLAAVPAALNACNVEVLAKAPIIASAPVGPSRRTYANGALLVEAALEPLLMLRCLQEIERVFGRVRRGQPWQARTLDLDIVVWSGGISYGPELTIPHPRFRERGFVLGPVAAIAPSWRDPLSGLSMRQLLARLRKPRPA